MFVLPLILRFSKTFSNNLNINKSGIKHVCNITICVSGVKPRAHCIPNQKFKGIKNVSLLDSLLFITTRTITGAEINNDF